LCGEEPIHVAPASHSLAGTFSLGNVSVTVPQRNDRGGLTDSLLDGADPGSMTQGGAAWRKKLLRTSVCLRWCGMALVVAGPLIVAAALLHPSRETAATIIASESRLVDAHVLFTLYVCWSC
jgi:hypothetical protein